MWAGSTCGAKRDTIEKLTGLPNIDRKLAENLEKIGVTTPEQFRELGAEEGISPHTRPGGQHCLPPPA